MAMLKQVHLIVLEPRTTLTSIWPYYHGACWDCPVTWCCYIWALLCLNPEPHRLQYDLIITEHAQTVLLPGAATFGLTTLLCYCTWTYELTTRFGWESARLILRDLGQWARSRGIKPDSHPKQVDNSGSATTVLTTKYLYNDAKCLFLSERWVLF